MSQHLRDLFVRSRILLAINLTKLHRKPSSDQHWASQKLDRAAYYRRSDLSIQAA
jgi:hypothetical protein